MNTNPPCRRCGGKTWRSTQTCLNCGDMADFGPTPYTGVEWATTEAQSPREQCDLCGESFTIHGLRRHRAACAIEVMML